MVLHPQVMMPEGAADSRGAQKAALAGVIYDKRTEPALGALLQALRGPDGAPAAGLGPVEAAVVSRMALCCPGWLRRRC